MYPLVLKLTGDVQCSGVVRHSFPKPSPLDVVVQVIRLLALEVFFFFEAQVTVDAQKNKKEESKINLQYIVRKRQDRNDNHVNITHSSPNNEYHEDNTL